MDPAKSGLNFYAYCMGNPLNFSDPYGLLCGNNGAEEAERVVNEAISKSTLWEAITGNSGGNVDQELRYIDTELFGTIDLQHLVSAAFGLPGAPTIGGLGVEIKQLFTDIDSAFKTEDLVSNILGGIARDIARRDGISIGQAVKWIIDNAGAKGGLYGRCD